VVLYKNKTDEKMLLKNRPKLLIVDDQSINIRILNELFQEEFDVFMAKDGAQALEKCETLLPDVILLDVVMPVMDGYEVCRKLKASETLADISVIFISSHSNQEEEALGFQVGAVDFIHKPINPVVTRARVLNHLLFKQQSDLLRSLISVDGLTGIANRRKFQTELVPHFLRCAREKQPISVLMIDVDFFKLYNDHYGHPAGDQCLQIIAQTISDTLHRPGDLAARYGGEEFCCLLPNTDKKGAQHLAQLIIQCIRALQIEHAKSTLNPWVTVSIGVASVIPKANLTPDDLVNEADRQLYRAKESGRNQFCAAEISK
jgi:diguanylate cyclase (GGDEF)-like protein